MARPRIAVILTQYGELSHGMCICSKLVEGLEFEGHFEPPRCDVVAMHLLEVSDDDIGLDLAARHGIPLYHSVAAALCEGGDELSVDGVVVIGEHGTYPFNAKGQKLYPRRELLDQVAAVFTQSQRVVPVFSDKHFSWNWAWAKHMWATINELSIPWMAGSSLPFADFSPAVELPGGRAVDHVIAFGYGDLDQYGFHALETGQFVVEQRAGGEAGVASVQCLTGPDVWAAHDRGVWPADIAEAAFAAVHTPKSRVRDCAEVPAPFDGPPFGPVFGNHAIDIRHRDGQRMTVFLLNGFCEEFGFAYRALPDGETVAASYFLDPPPRVKHFSTMVRAIEDLMLTGTPTVPPERTLLTTGVLAAAVESHAQGGAVVATPDLGFSYALSHSAHHASAPKTPEG